MDSDVNMYKGVGKMSVSYFSLRLAWRLTRGRFLMVPRPAMEKDLKGQEKELTDDINNLNKKVSPKGVSYSIRLSRNVCSPNIWRNNLMMLKINYAISYVNIHRTVYFVISNIITYVSSTMPQNNNNHALKLCIRQSPHYLKQ